jgi:N-methylhydantoinase A
VLKERFEVEYTRLFGRGALVALQTIEIFTLRVRAVVSLKARGKLLAMAAGTSGPVGEREVFWPGQMQWLTTAVWDGRKLRADDRVEGPAVVELPHTTVAIAPNQRLTVRPDGSLTLILH